MAGMFLGQSLHAKAYSYTFRIGMVCLSDYHHSVVCRIFMRPVYTVKRI